MTGSSMAAAAPATAPAPIAIDGLGELGIVLGLIDGRVGRRIHDQVAAGVDQCVLDARWIGEIELGAADQNGLRPWARARSARARAT